MERKHYASITVQEIIDEADIGRSTFYAHFETKDELLREMCSDIFDHVFSDEITREKEHDFSHNSLFKDRITHILYHLREKQHSINGLFSGECGEVFTRYFKEYLFKVFDSHISEGDSIPHDYAVNIAMTSFAETVRWWLRENSGYSPEQVSEFFFECTNRLYIDNTVIK